MDWTCTHNIATGCRAAVVNAPDDLYTTWRLQGGSSRGGTDGRRDQRADNRARKMKLSLCTVETSIRILQVQGQEKASFQVAMEVERWPRVQTHAIGTPKAEAVGSDPRWRGKCSASCMTADGGRQQQEAEGSTGAARVGCFHQLSSLHERLQHNHGDGACLCLRRRRHGQVEPDHVAGQGRLCHKQDPACTAAHLDSSHPGHPAKCYYHHCRHIRPPPGARQLAQ